MDLDRLFYPRSIAFVGASPNLMSGKIPFYHFHRHSGYTGDIYAINPKYKEIDGNRVYASLEELPASADLAIVSVPAENVLDVVRAAVKKEIRFVHLFTSGFSETGNHSLEKEMLQTIEGSKTRIVGPNCIGVLCTESKVTFNPLIKQEGPGKVGFLGQSGGVSDNFVLNAQSHRIELNKAVSFGNQIDLRAEDYLTYFAQDESIRAIAAYIEDVKDSKSFITALRETSRKKPIVVLKGGRTKQGTKAAFSHTGAMSGSYQVFSAIMRQLKCIEVQTFEQMIDVTMLATADRIPRGGNIGFVGAGGGTSVMFTDLANLQGLVLPELNQKTKQDIARHISTVNTSTTNPVDLGAYGFSFSIMAHAMQALDEDDNIDVIIPYFCLDYIKWQPKERREKGPPLIVETYRKLQKPVIPIISLFSDDNPDIEAERIRMFSLFRQAGLPVYTTLTDAVNAVRSILTWSAPKKSASL
ncbi:MAG: CoA-binding protein [Deltaproteobacteria bacterium]|nr:CoA-binding protein [Deltaproteobacteria bacterium]